VCAIRSLSEDLEERGLNSITEFKELNGAPF